MNLCPCDVSQGQADLGEGVRLALPPGLSGFSGKLTLGIRPENLTLEERGPGGISAPARLTLVEPLGSETLITVRMGAAELIARVGAGFNGVLDAPLTLHLQPGDLHLFDPADGRALK